MIALISTLSLIVIDAEARTYDKESEYTLDGLGMFLFAQSDVGDRINLQIFPIEDTKDLFVKITGKISGEQIKQNCIAPKQILKNSATNKASADFDTADLICSESKGPDTIISASIMGTGVVFDNDKFDHTDCNINSEGIDECSRDHGSIKAYLGIGNISGYGITIDNQDAEIRIVKMKHTEWTTP